MSTKTKIKKLPKGLPELPPIPAGYDAWEYLGKGPIGRSLINEYADSCDDGDTSWSAYAGINQFEGDGCGHYIRAIKHPAPKVAKKTKAVKDGPWSYTPMRAMLRLNGKAFAIVTPNGKDALDPKDAETLVITLNKGEAK